MRKKIFSTLAIGCLLALIIVVPARAQMPGTAIRASIPFDFIVRGKVLPAGNYEIKRLGDAPDALVIRNVNESHEHEAFETASLESSDGFQKSEIVFHRYGDSYFLSEILTAGYETGREVIPSRVERHLRREMAKNGGVPETIALAVE